MNNHERIEAAADRMAEAAADVERWLALIKEKGIINATDEMHDGADLARERLVHAVADYRHEKETQLTERVLRRIA